MISTFQFGQLSVTRQDSGNINITSGHGGRRGGVPTDLNFSRSTENADTFELRGEKDREECNWNIQVSANGVSAREARHADRRSLFGAEEQVTSSAQTMTLAPEQFEAAALAAASGIVGLPLSLLALPQG